MMSIRDRKVQQILPSWVKMTYYNTITLDLKKKIKVSFRSKWPEEKNIVQKSYQPQTFEL